MPLRCFIPRARVGRDAPPDRQQQSHKVSIHAPAWGATGDGVLEAHVGDVSIHTPAWGATPKTATVAGLARFQSTRPRGARHSKRPDQLQRRCFNPRARVGRDVALGNFEPSDVGFNPRARVGRDCSRAARPLRPNCFNPRARVGRDIVLARLQGKPGSFNPRARVGRDRREHDRPLREHRFNPRARVGRDGWI